MQHAEEKEKVMNGRLKVTAAATVGVLALSGCGSMPVNKSASTSSQAPSTSGRSAHIPTTGILVSTNLGDHDLHPAWTADARRVAVAAGQSGAHVIIDRFGTGPQSSDVMFNAPLISADGQNSLIRRAQVAHAEDEMVTAFDQEQATAIPGPTDVISGIQKMEDHLSELQAASPDVIIFGDAVQAAGPVNLADPVQLADPRLTLEKIKAQGLLRASACHGWNVYMVNPSPAGFSGLQDEQLREFWREFFTACGGHLVLWDSTLIFPAGGQISQANWATFRHRRIIIPLPASVLFRPDHAILLPGAGRILGELCRDLTSVYPTATAAIAGYTAAAGRGDGMALSQARAQVLASYLEACGVGTSRLSVHGYGDRDQIPGGLEVNRRVVVTLQLR
jgi:outer membrane protein OmpA-like peptidoglycan-associated protein